MYLIRQYIDWIDKKITIETADPDHHNWGILELAMYAPSSNDLIAHRKIQWRNSLNDVSSAGITNTMADLRTK